MRLRTSALVLALAATGAIAGDVAAQAQRAGVVTTVTGTVTVARDAASPTPLRFRDDIYLHDRIAAAERSLARILLGGKAVVTVSERSVVTITEAPGRSTIDLISGRISLAVARERMKAGDTVEIRTPIAVAGVRGTVVIAEILGAGAARFTVVKGLVEVASLDPRTKLALPAPTAVLAARQTLVATPRGLGVPQTISPEAAQRLGAAFKPAPPTMPTQPAAGVAETQLKKATQQARDLLGRAYDDGRGRSREARDGARKSNDGPGTETRGKSGHDSPLTSTSLVPASDAPIAMPKADVPRADAVPDGPRIAAPPIANAPQLPKTAGPALPMVISDRAPVPIPDRGPLKHAIDVIEDRAKKSKK